jgi:hypothetical protein
MTVGSFLFLKEQIKDIIIRRAPWMPTRHGTSRNLGWTCACTSRTTRADLASQQQTTPSPDTRPHTRRSPGLLPSSAPLPALLNRSDCRATTSRIQPPGWPPLSACSNRCTRTSYSTMTAPISLQQHIPRCCLVQSAGAVCSSMLLQMQA